MAAMVSTPDETPWQIVMAQLPLAFGLAGHNFLVLLDGNAYVVSEVNGLAIGRDGSVRAVGWRPGDRLRAVVSSGACYYRADLGQAVLYAGPRQAAMDLWLKAEEKACAINTLALKYPFLGCGKNSNSVASTLIHAMGLPECQPSRSAVIDFGRGMLVV
ncbi:MAG: hypothetical protein ACK4FZ_11600 [Vogesella sp.]|uniref:hypothetical protein n=1 Tax=Vogesella sp. TaxID=1904252 RepID=UPI00391A93A1